MPFPTIDPQVVRRSAAALDRYGPEFRYGHYVLLKKFTSVAGLIGGASTLFALAQFKPTRDWLLSRKSSGEGPSAERRAKSWFKVRFHGEGGGKRVVTEVSGGDPGYSSYLLNFPRTGSGVAVLCNTSGAANPVGLAEQAAAVYLEAELGADAPLPATITAAQVAGMEGLYWSDSLEASARVAVDSGIGVWRVGQGATRLRSRADGAWQLGAGQATLRREGDGMLMYKSGNGERAVYRRVDPVTPRPPEVAAMAGRYSSEELGVAWELRVQGDSLMLRRPKFAPARLQPVFRDTWAGGSGLGFVIRAIRDARGKVTAITVGSGRVRHMRFERTGE